MDPICDKTGNPCRFCSNETLTNVSRVGIIATGRIERRVSTVNLGQFCNNDGRHYVRDLPACPVPGALAAPLVKHELSELEWMRRKGVR